MSVFAPLQPGRTAWFTQESTPPPDPERCARVLDRALRQLRENDPVRERRRDPGRRRVFVEREDD